MSSTCLSLPSPCVARGQSIRIRPPHSGQTPFADSAQLKLAVEKYGPPDEVFSAYFSRTEEFDSLRPGQRRGTRRRSPILFVTAFSWILHVPIKIWVGTVIICFHRPSLLTYTVIEVFLWTLQATRLLAGPGLISTDCQIHPRIWAYMLEVLISSSDCAALQSHSRTRGWTYG